MRNDFFPEVGDILPDVFKVLQSNGNVHQLSGAKYLEESQSKVIIDYVLCFLLFFFFQKK